MQFLLECYAITWEWIAYYVNTPKQHLFIHNITTTEESLTLKCTRRLGPRALHDFVAFSGSREYRPIVV